MRRLILVIGWAASVATAVLCTPVAAQQHGDRLDTPVRRLERSLAGRTRIRVRTDSSWVVLVQPRLVGQTLISAADTGARIPLDRIAHVQVRGSAAGTGALVGLTVGAVAGAAAGVALANFCFWACEPPTTGETIRAGALGAVFFEVDPLRCPRCGHAMRIVGFITQPHVIDRILGEVSV